MKAHIEIHAHIFYFILIFPLSSYPIYIIFLWVEIPLMKRIHFNLFFSAQLNAYKKDPFMLFSNYCYLPK